MTKIILFKKKTNWINNEKGNEKKSAIEFQLKWKNKYFRKKQGADTRRIFGRNVFIFSYVSDLEINSKEQTLGASSENIQSNIIKNATDLEQIWKGSAHTSVIEFHLKWKNKHFKEKAKEQTLGASSKDDMFIFSYIFDFEIHSKEQTLGASSENPLNKHDKKTPPNGINNENGNAHNFDIEFHLKWKNKHFRKKPRSRH